MSVVLSYCKLFGGLKNGWTRTYAQYNICIDIFLTPVCSVTYYAQYSIWMSVLVGVVAELGLAKNSSWLDMDGLE